MEETEDKIGRPAAEQKKLKVDMIRVRKGYDKNLSS
jgi:hypothetical protein